MGAPLNPVPQVLRCFIEGFVDGDAVYKWGNVLFYHYTGSAPSTGDCNAIAENISNGWNSDMAPACPSPTTLTTVTVVDLTSPSANEGSWNVTHAGTRGDDSIPANAAFLISYPGGSRYRGGHPRSYLYVLGNADLEGAAHWSSAATTEVANDWQNFLQHTIGYVISGTTIDTFGHVRYHGKYLPNSGPPHYYLDSPIYTPFDPSFLVGHQEIASQRRRVGRRKA